MACPVCAWPETKRMATKRAVFFRCSRCSFAFLDPALRPSDQAARERYALHRNTPGDPGYVAFLSATIDRALEAAGPRARRVIDWGSGPVAVCSGLLRDRGFDVDSWDPFYSPEPVPPAESYDVAVCIEVAEHFFDPVADFIALASRLKPGGILALHTHLVPDGDDAFRAWWYKEDPTHVSFYSEAALRHLAFVCSLVPLSFERERFALFRRPLPVLVAGGANWDAEGRPFAPLIPGDSNPGTIRFFPGGAARNVAEDLGRLSVAAEFVSIVGSDASGAEIRDGCVRAGIGAAGLETSSEYATSSYLSILDADGEAALALSGMGIFDGFGPEAVLAAAERAEVSARGRSLALAPGGLPEAAFSAIVVDGNLRADAVDALLSRYAAIPAWLDPVSASKAKRLGAYGGGTLIGRFAGMKPNLREAEELLGQACSGDSSADRGLEAAASLRRRGAGDIYVSLGADGVAWMDDASSGVFHPPSAELVSTTGAGDAFLASLVRSAVLGRSGRSEAIRAAAAAAIAMRSEDACPKDLSGGSVESMAESIIDRGDLLHA